MQRVRNEPNHHLDFDIGAFNPKGLVSAIPQSVATQQNIFGHVPEKWLAGFGTNKFKDSLDSGLIVIGDKTSGPNFYTG